MILRIFMEEQAKRNRVLYFGRLFFNVNRAQSLSTNSAMYNDDTDITIL